MAFEFDPHYFDKLKLELDAAKHEMDVESQRLHDIRKAELEFQWAKKVAELKAMESRARRTSR